MKGILIGFLLIFLNFNITLNASKIGLIPDFIGYIVMRNGLLEMAAESPLFLKAKPFATFMAFYTGILYLTDLVGFSASLGLLSIILGIVSIIIFLYISYHIVMGVNDMEESYNTSFSGNSLKTTWTILAVCNILSFVFVSIPTPILATICIIVSVIVAIYFLIVFNTSKNLYLDMKSRL